MTLISSIIQDAFRESNIIPLGVSPNANQVTEALRLLNALFASVLGGDAGENLQDWPLGGYGREYSSDVPSTYELAHPNINSRLIASNTAAITVYLPVRPQAGSRISIIDPLARLATVPVTLNGNGRTIEGATTQVLNINSTAKEWVYRDDLGDWVLISSKVETDQMPFPADFDIFFTTLLAMRLDPRYGRSMDPLTLQLFKSERQAFVARYLQSARLEILDDVSWPFMSQQSYNTQRTTSQSQNFNRGDVW